jgi:hypothetical protein
MQGFMMFARIALADHRSTWRSWGWLRAKA